MTVKLQSSFPAILSTVSTYYGVSGMTASEEGWDAGPGGDWRGWRCYAQVQTWRHVAQSCRIVTAAQMWTDGAGLSNK